MARLSSVRARKRGNRLLRERLECAVLDRPADALHEVRGPRIAAGIGGAIVAVVLVAVLVLGATRPTANATDLVMTRDSGALFVRIGGKWHPVANIASARLILGAAKQPVLIDQFWPGEDRGAMLGIPGAPQALGSPLDASEVKWTVCDGVNGATTVRTSIRGGRELDGTNAVLVKSTGGDKSTYLLYSGQRAVVDVEDPVITRALGIGGVTARPASSTLLNMLPEVPEIRLPRIAGMGQPSRVANYRVGTVVRVIRADSVEWYVVLPDGLQRIGPLAADAIRFAGRSASEGLRDISPERVAESPLVDELAIGNFPVSPPRLLDVRGDLCVVWSAGASTLVTEPESGGPRTELVHRDDAGPAVDYFVVPGGRSIDVNAVSSDALAEPSSRLLITDRGLRFALADGETANALGLNGTPVLAPWTLISVLAAGPDLNRSDASVAVDVFTPTGPAP